MEPTLKYDFLVIGGGSAGYAAARTAASLKLKTAVADNAEELGGLCILRGCMPSKTLIESANRNLVIRHASDFGLKATPGPADTRFIRDRKRALIDEFASYRQGQLADGRFDLLRARASFVSTTDESITLELHEGEGKSRRIEAASVLIATGSVIHTPDIPGLKHTGFLTSDTILETAEIPESVIVLGGGAIALEMAHYLDGIGRKTTVIQRSARVLKEMDADAAEVIEKAFVRRGMSVYTDTKLVRVEKTAAGKRVTFSHKGNEETTHVEADEILMALGRTPAIKGLNLEAVSVKCQDNGRIKINSSQQSTNPRIFAAGDVCGPLEVVHMAIQQAEIAAKNAAALLKGETLKHHMDYRCKLFGVFTEPQAASVGLNETEAEEKGIAFIKASYPFDDHGKSQVMGELDGFVKLLADPVTGTILGGSVVGPEGTEIIHEIAIAMHLGATVADLAAAPHYHPTLSEIWTYPAEDLAAEIPS